MLIKKTSMRAILLVADLALTSPFLKIINQIHFAPFFIIIIIINSSSQANMRDFCLRPGLAFRTPHCHTSDAKVHINIDILHLIAYCSSGT